MCGETVRTYLSGLSNPDLQAKHAAASDDLSLVPDSGRGKDWPQSCLSASCLYALELVRRGVAERVLH